MKRVQLMGIGLALTMSVLISTVARADDAAVKKALEAQYAKSNKAIKAKDAKGLMALTTPDMTMKAQGQTMNRKQVEAQMKMQFGMARSISPVVTIDKLTVKGDQATAMTTDKMAIVISDQEGKTHKIDLTGKWKDTWAKAGGTWKIKAKEQISSKMLMDGKPMNPGGPPPPK